jgi:hypothetical protein
MKGEEKREDTKDRVLTLLFDMGAVDGEAYTVTSITIADRLKLHHEHLDAALRELTQRGLLGSVEEEGTSYWYLTLLGVQHGKLLDMRRARMQTRRGGPDMSEGDSYAKKLDQILLLMYDAGAIGIHHVVDDSDLGKGIGADGQELQDLISLLVQQGFVKKVVRGKYHLTGPGFAQARTLAEARTPQQPG